MQQPIYIFDLDGTLIDSRADLAAAINLMRADRHLPPLPQETVTGYVGDGMKMLVTRALHDAGDDVDVDNAVAAMRSHYADHLLDQTVLYPGVEEALEAFAAAPCHLAIVTNKPAIPARRICKALGIDGYFSHILGGDSCAERKPDPGPLLQVIQDTGADTGQSWMIGDHVTDLEAGRRAGLKRCFCRFGFGRRDAQEPDLEVDSLLDFAAAVLQRTGR